jgi:hypothetical protein
VHSDGVGWTWGTERDASKVAEDGDAAVGFGIFANDFARCDIFETVGEEVGMGVAEDKWAELGDRDEAAKVEVSGLASRWERKMRRAYRLRFRISRSG